MPEKAQELSDVSVLVQHFTAVLDEAFRRAIEQEHYNAARELIDLVTMLQVV